MSQKLFYRGPSFYFMKCRIIIIFKNNIFEIIEKFAWEEQLSKILDFEPSLYFMTKMGNH